MISTIQKLSVFLIVIISLFGGCFEEKIVNSEYDFYVDDDYLPTTKGYNETHFSSIYNAINKSFENATIYVYSGIYYENIIIEKTISLLGENANTTFLDGRNCSDDIITINGPTNVLITGFTFRNNAGEDKFYHNAAIDIRSDNNQIQKNIFINNTCGIYTRYSNANTVTKNKFMKSTEYGVYFHTGSNDNTITDNVFENNNYGLRIKGNSNCRASYNLFQNNSHGIYLCCGANYNILYGNNFCNNTEWDADDPYNNAWDTGTIPKAWFHNKDINIEKEVNESAPFGNYWDAYHLPSQGAYDNNTDGIIDTPYNFPDGETPDSYPLAQPLEINNPFLPNKSQINCQ
jgi:parallel beta-helix repeat protein